MRCDGCTHWEVKRRRGDRAPCRGVGPQMKVSNDPVESSIGHWPRTLADEWCINHKPIPPVTGIGNVEVTVV
jgi:hypothetical protein